MESPRTRRHGDGSPSARTLALTVLGEYVRYAGDERVAAGAVVGALGACGIGDAAARRALGRLGQEGWLRSEPVGRRTRLVLEPRLVRLLTAWTHRLERAVDTTPWSGEWQQLVLRPPGGVWRERALLEQQLAFEGFGALSPGLWCAADPGGVPALKGLFREQGLASHALWLTCRAEDDAELVSRTWELDDVRRAHEEFLARFGGRGVREARDPEGAFVARTRLVHAWRGTFERDPRLPDALLPRDWPGREATRLFVDAWRALRAPADTYWRQLTVGMKPLASSDSDG
ncbi:MULTISPECIES: PaaX family transcriptional regulator C-terminal domain-containing protein [unclassified Streptomyces]|uniref:PaaX family transcriptional regulator n=1 Tax=unclassified Streptomyces TaxID=2593676 RepID=UPI00278BB5B9|nr:MULTISPECIES: PaaX family transcriptional regulator C-terminal domain-containing protein [unclassified Streptomyces]